MRCTFSSLAVLAFLSSTAAAEVRLSKLFSDHMVLQREKKVPIWGWASPGEAVSVSFAGQTVSSTANDKGAWMVTLEPLKTSTQPQVLTVKGSNTVTVNDVLVGEVWLCSGQSNMEWTVKAALNADLHELSAHRYPNLRMITVRTPGQQTPVEEPDQVWKLSTPAEVSAFSAVGFFFGRQLYDTLVDVPIGLINNSWGGSACEAWIRRELITDPDLGAPLIKRWEQIEATYNFENELEKHRAAMAKWKEAEAAAKAENKPVPPAPHPPQDQMKGNHRPGNLYHGRLKPVMPYALRGCIWYQGESNADRAYQYRYLFPLMIECWRKDWNDDFSFYWAQLADFKNEVPNPAEASWAELREAQTMTLTKLPKTGEAVIIDLGEANDIHPRAKEEVGRRLARWALAKDYGIAIPCQSPTYQSLEIKDGKAIVTFKEVGDGLRTLDVNELKGFAIAGEDKQWKKATAKVIAKDKVEVSSEEVPDPKAVRYAWADNPVCNLYAKNGLPATPFRTDDWEGITSKSR